MRGLLTWLILLLAVELAATSPLWGQQASLRWLGERIDLGAPVEAELTVNAPQGSRIFLADTALAFAPYELEGVVRRDSSTSAGTTSWVTRFRLVSFNVDEKQALKLVVFVQAKGDTAHALTAHSDTIRYQPRITGDPEKQPFQYDLTRLHVSKPIDLLRVWLVIAGGAVAFALAFLALRKPLLRWWRRRRLARYGRRVKGELMAVRELTHNAAAFIQQLNRVWKEDLQRSLPLKDSHWKSLSSVEMPVILRRQPELSDDSVNLLAELCQHEDRIFYGRKRIDENEMLRIWQNLYNYMEAEIERRRRELR